MPIFEGMGAFARRVKILIILAILASSTPLMADFGAGVAAYKRGEFELARTEFERLAAAGDARAQFAIGLMYDNGEGVGRDDGPGV